MKKRFKPPPPMAACPSCFAFIAPPFLSWHQLRCASASNSVGVQMSSPALLAPPTPIKKADSRDCSCVETRHISLAAQNPDSCSPADGLESDSNVRVEGRVVVRPVEEHVQQAHDVVSCHTQDGFLSQSSEIDVQNLKSAMLTLKRDYQESLDKVKELEMKYKDLLNKEEDLQRQLTLSKAAEKEALSLVETLRAQLHDKAAALSDCVGVEVVDVEGGPQHMDCRGTVDVDTVSVSFGNWRNGSSLDPSPETNPSASLGKKLDDICPKIDHVSDFVFRSSGNSKKAFSSILGESSKPPDMPIDIDEMRTFNVSNSVFESQCQTEADQSSTLAYIPKSCPSVVSDLEERSEQPRHVMIQKPLTEGETTESSRVLPSVSGKIEAVSKINITDMDLSTEEPCGLVLPPTNISNKLHASASGETDCAIKNTKSGACPHVTVSDSETESACREYADTNVLRGKGSLASMKNTVIPESQVQLHLEKNSEGTAGAGFQKNCGLPLPEVHVGSHLCENLSSASDETDFVFKKAKSGVRHTVIMSDSESESRHEQGTEVVKSSRKFQGGQENDVSMVSCVAADGQSNYSNADMGAKNPETPMVDAMGAGGDGREQRERDSTAVRRSMRLIKLSTYHASNNNETTRSLNEERTSNKRTNLDKESSDCQSVSESGKFADKTDSSESGPSMVRNLCLKRRRPSRTRKRLFDDLSETESDHRHSKKTVVLRTEFSSHGEDSEEEDESCEDNSLNGFIVDSNSDESDGSTIPHEDLSGTTGESESVDRDQAHCDFRRILYKRRKNYDWDFQTDMQAVLDEDPELCLRAVCALYRQQTEEEQRERGSLYTNKRGFDKIHAEKGSLLAEFLTDGDPSGPMKKTVDDLKRHDAKAVDFCMKLAFHHSKQLFEIYKNGEDPHFPYD